MSELSEDIKEAVERLTRHSPTYTDDVASVTVVREGEGVANVPCFKSMQLHYGQEVIKVVRRAYRHNCGREPYASTREAMDGTRDSIKSLVIPKLMSAFSDGVQIAQANSSVVRKFSFFDKLDEVFENKNFRTDSDMMVLNMALDFDVTEFFNMYLIGSTEYFAMATGYAHTTDIDSLNKKIWDVWAMASVSVVTALYAAGYKVGETWKERDVLRGIASATEATKE